MQSSNGHYSKLFDLTGQTAIVTGAATGLGEAVAHRFAQAGATVAVLDLNGAGAESVACNIKHGAFPLRADVGDAKDVEAAVQEVLARTGRIDILVNNAGIAGTVAPAWEQTEENWEKAISVNIMGVFNLFRAVVPHMRSRQYGRIVNVSSIAGKEGNPNMSVYSATKAAVIAFTKSAGKELATEGICVNAIAPAVIHTKILDQLTPEQVRYMTDKIPMRRTGGPDEIAAVIHFLSSPDSSFITAQCYDASGGRATY